jgi:hypothetical protein
MVNIIPTIKRIQSAVSARYYAALALLTMAMPALAGTGAQQTTGWGRVFSNFTALGNTVAVTVTTIAFVGGLGAIGRGGWLLVQKGDSERGEDIKTSRIIWMFVGGAICMAITYFGATTLESMGANANGAVNTNVRP